MPFSQSDIDELKAGIATGARRVRYADGREVEYRSLADMRDTLRLMQADVVQGQGSSGGPRSFVAGFS